MQRLAPRLRTMLHRGVQKSRRIWIKAGLRFKIKILVGVYQCIAAVPSVYNVDVPDDMQAISRWIDLLEWPADMFGVVVPAACFGSYRHRLLVASLGPLLLLFGWVLCTGGVDAIKYAHDPGRRAVPILHRALQRILPPTTLVTFILVTSASTRIFKTFRTPSGIEPKTAQYSTQRCFRIRSDRRVF
eukprot:3908160-Prymnesium_polylepis.1